MGCQCHSIVNPCGHWSLNVFLRHYLSNYHTFFFQRPCLHQVITCIIFEVCTLAEETITSFLVLNPFQIKSWYLKLLLCKFLHGNMMEINWSRNNTTKEESLPSYLLQPALYKPVMNFSMKCRFMLSKTGKRLSCHKTQDSTTSIWELGFLNLNLENWVISEEVISSSCKLEVK